MGSMYWNSMGFIFSDNLGNHRYQRKKDLANHQEDCISNRNGADGVIPVISFNPYNVNRLQVADSPNTHIGPKFIASHLTIQLPSQQSELNKRSSRRWLCATVGSAALLLTTCLTMVFAIPSPIVQTFPDDGNIAYDWYYDRELMNMSTCPESNINVIAELIVVDSMESNCNDVDACVDVIRTLPEGAHFYLKNGHVFEGLGWYCGPTEHMKIVFLSEELSQTEMYSFNKLLEFGKVIKMVDSKCEVLPICCAGESMGPSKSVINFLKTLVSFRNRDCVIKHKNCN